MPPPRDVLETMRADWNQRAREDAYYYVAFAHPEQSTADFQSTASPIVPVLEAEFPRLPALPSECKVLEVGCGPGRVMLPMSSRFAEIHGVDVSDEMIARARELLRDVPNAHPQAGSGTDLAMFDDESFDFVYSYAVFQHIPSKEVVLNYLREIQRVLKPAGIFRGQFHGLPQSENPDTWAGCSFTENEIAEFAAEWRMQLLALIGEGTQYLWTTFRKVNPSGEADVSEVAVLAVTAAHGQATVPQRGAYAAVSLWIGGMPDTCDLNDLSVSFNGGRPVRPCYLTPIGPGGGCQLNAVLPRGVAARRAKIGLYYRGRFLSEGSIEVTEGPAPRPLLVTVTDGSNRLAEFTVASEAFKAILEDVGDPKDVYFAVDGRSAAVVHRTCLNQVRDQYYYTVLVPPGVRSGKSVLTIRASEVDLPPVELTVR